MLSSLQWVTLSCHCRCVSPVRLPEFAGAALRGGFGLMLRDQACARGGRCGSRCANPAVCGYGRVFEPPLPAGLAGLGGEQAPRPFVFRPPIGERTLAEGATFEIGLVLIGAGITALPRFVMALQELGATGVGKGGGRFEVERVVDISGNGVYDGESGSFTPPSARRSDELSGPAPEGATRLEIRFRSATRIQKDGSVLSDLPFSALIVSLARRVEALGALYCGAEWRGGRLSPELYEQATWVTLIRNETERVHRARFSTRQKRHMEMDGQTGVNLYAGPWQGFWPLLRLGEEIHVGKATTFGMGEFRLRPQ